MTPDSFYDGGRYQGEEAQTQFDKLSVEGADIIDVGAESSRPGSERISEREELARLAPLFESWGHRIGAKGPLISIDTMKGAVARYALEHGAAIVNDITALRFDPEGMTAALKAFPKSRVVLMHMLGDPKNMQANPRYENVISEINNFFEERLEFLSKSGISAERVILDPGIGFGKRLEDNLEILANISAFKKFGRPVLVGASRKSMIGVLLGGLPAQERLEGTLAAHLFCARQGVEYLRVHDVAATKRALTVWSALDSVQKKEAWV